MSEAPAGVRSMTGYGSSRAESGGYALEAEARSVNHRHLKLHVRLPEQLGPLVPRVEERLRQRLGRGTVNLQVRVVGLPEGAGYRLDTGLLSRFFRELLALAESLGTEAPRLAEVAALPGVVQVEEPGAGDELWPLVLEAVDGALDALEAMRAREGAGIVADLDGVAGQILAQAQTIEARVPEAVKLTATRLEQRVGQLLGEAQLGPDELAREVALLADKSDVAEEVQRLRSHVEQLQGTLRGGTSPVGRKLEFLAQELHRESNTISSKNHDPVIAAATLELKLLVERVREQVANVE